jgi:L-iditol 2-dehydrogenase
MKALVLKEYLDFEYMDVQTPEIKAGDVLVRIKACAICGSDVHGFDGSSGRRIPPVIMGHEAAGVVEAVGSDVKNFSVGDRVTFDSTIYCRSCSPCSTGNVNLCDDRRVLGVSCGDYRKDGAMAEYVAVPEYILYLLPDSVSFETASVIEPLAVALHSINRTSIRAGDKVMVAGCGTIGMLTLKLLNIMGCSLIIAVDIDDFKLEMAKKNGADYVINSKSEDVAQRIIELTNGEKVDAAFEAVGISETVEYSINSLKKGGELTLVGNIRKNIDFPLQYVVTNEININTSCAIAGEYTACIKLLNSGKIDLSDIISVTAPLNEGAEWFDKLHKGLPGIIKVVLKP